MGIVGGYRNFFNAAKGSLSLIHVSRQPIRGIGSHERRRAYIFASAVRAESGLVGNDREIIALFEADTKNAEFVEYQRTWLKNYIRKLKIETVKASRTHHENSTEHRK